MLVHCAFLTLLILKLVNAQPAACTYSCPDTNQQGQALLKRVLAVPFQSDYSVFECVYGEINANPRTQSCFYNKTDGKKSMGSKVDQCPIQAIPCSETTQRFSSPGHPEVPAWVENGRYLLYVTENHT